MRTACLLAALLAVTPALAAESCIVDYESFEVRGLLDSDPASILSEQSINSYEWGLEPSTVVADNTYEKYGLPRVLFSTEVKFFAFKDSVPFLHDLINTETPPGLLYAPTNGEGCEFQPYALKAS